MYISEEKITELYVRESKLGISHQYKRTKTVINFQCDSCGQNFQRTKGEICIKRRSNKYYHCCSKCDNKRFAQSKSVEKRLIWNMPVSSTVTIDKF